MEGAESIRPERLYTKETGEPPYDVDLAAPGWELVTAGNFAEIAKLTKEAVELVK